MSTPRSPGRRAAPRSPSRLDAFWRALVGVRAGVETLAEPGDRLLRLYRVAGAAICAGGVGMLLLALAGLGPVWLDGAGAAAVVTSYTVALAVRTGGRPVVFGGLILLLCVLTLVTDDARLRAGAAVLTATISAVLGVMATVPAVRYRDAMREALIAVGISAAGALAVVGFRPVVSLQAFDYVSLAFAFGLVFVLVFRLGAGWHGLGRRGLIVVLVGSVGLAVTLAYAELLRRYGADPAVDAVFDAVRWTRDRIGAAPRPIQALLGVPALVWGCHMRARRRQGWWVSAFGVAGTVSVAGVLINPAVTLTEAVLIVVYSLVPGLVLGYGIIRLDLSLTGPRGARARREEEANALRPEPRRLEPLF